MKSKLLKRIMAITLSVVMMVGAFPLLGSLSAVGAEYNNFTYETYVSGDVGEKVVEIYGYTGPENVSITIPATIEGYPVKYVYLCDEGFGDYVVSSFHVKTITIPSSVEIFSTDYIVENYAVLEGNKNYSAKDGVLFNADKTVLKRYPIGKTAKQYVIPNTVETIGYSAFYNASFLESVTIPGSVKEIQEGAFYCCSSLTTVLGCNNVQYVGSYVFEDTPYYDSEENWENGIFYVGGVLLCADKEVVSGNVQIKNGTSLICYNAFYEASKITSVTIPDSVKIIDSYAFAYCVGLKTVSFASNSELETISYGAFESCIALETIAIPSSVTTIESEAFYHCTSLRSVTGGTNVGKLDSDTFYDTALYLNESNWNNGLFCLLNNLLAAKDGITGAVSIPAGTKYIASSVFYNKDSLVSVNIPASVIEIGTCAFEDCDNLKEIAIPASVMKIGSCAFEDCYKLETITFASGSQLKTIDYYAFEDCNSLKEITIPASVTEIGGNAFAYCYRLTTVTFASGSKLETIGYSAFYDCNSLTSIKIPATVVNMAYNDYYYDDDGNRIEELGRYSGVFCDCNSMTKIEVESGNRYYSSDSNGILYNKDKTELFQCPGGKIGSVSIPSTVRTIGYSSFKNCYALEAVTFASGSQLKTIGGYSFYYCSSLTEIKIPAYVTEIGYQAFYNCYSIQKVTFESGSQLKKIGDGAFNNCSALTEITIPASVINMSSDSFYWDDNGNRNEVVGEYNRVFCSCDSLTKIKVESGNRYYSADSNGILYNKDKTELFQFPGGKETVSIPSTVKVIGNHSFYDCEKIQSITIPAAVTEIENSAFSYCYYLETVTFASGSQLKKIGDCAFYNCNALKEITIPASVVSMGSDYYYDDDGNLIEEGRYNGVLYSCDSLTKIKVESGNLYYSADSNGILYNKDKTELFQCPGGKEGNVSIPSTVKTICNYSFKECYSLTGVVVPSSVMKIGSYAFEDCHKLETITFASGSQLKTIGYDAFEYCDNLKEITIPASVTEIGDYAFAYCDDLQKVDFESGSQLEIIEYNTFLYCGALKEVKIPASVKHISYSAFYGCDNIQTVTFTGTEKMWNNRFNTGAYDSTQLRNAANVICTGEVVVDYEVAKDYDYDISVEYSLDDEQGNVRLDVQEEFDGSVFQILNVQPNVVSSTIFDIKFIVNDEVSQPNGKVTVKIPVPEGYDVGLTKIYHIDAENGTIEEMDAQYIDGYMVFTTDHFSYYAIVEVTEGPQNDGNVRSVKVDDTTINYKSSVTITPQIAADEGASYTVTYTSSNPSVATVDNSGKVTSVKQSGFNRGSTVITCTVTDSYGNTVTDTCRVTVQLTWWQWIIKIVLFGWIWY